MRPSLLSSSTRSSFATAAAFALGIAALAAGCASDPGPAPSLLTLPNAVIGMPPVQAGAPASAASAAEPPLLAVRRIAIPEYLVARRVRYRADPSTLAEWPNTYWAERIEVGVSREFLAALRSQLPGWTLCENNCGDRVPALTLQVEMVPMDYLRSAQKLQAHARVVLSNGGSGPRLLRAQEWNYELPASADTAQAHAQAVTNLIRQVATATATLVRSVPL
ncbi:MAG TPA: ABC-type transport auxiliary lipoprotein family protein [Burkholderiaceae bacterium]|nr:ABC-type transport auxiliary lipoprotein family protein [Burkholderiaceae bacterium]